MSHVKYVILRVFIGMLVEGNCMSLKCHAPRQLPNHYSIHRQLPNATFAEKKAINKTYRHVSMTAGLDEEY